jgi:uncharacterized membrane protein YecN with MAPEG domain
MPNIKKVGILSAALLAVQLVLTKFLYPVIGKTTQTVFAIGENINPVSGIGGQQIGDKIIGYLSGYIPFDISNWNVLIMMMIGTFAITYLGMLLYEQKLIKLWQGKNLTQRLFAMLAYGHIVLYIALLIMKWSVPEVGVNLLIGLSLNLILVSAIITLSADKLGFPKV